VAINSHEVDAACKKGTEFAHEEDSGVEEVAGNTAADCKLVCSRQMARGKWAKAYRVQESKAKRYNSKRPKEVEEKCKWRLYHSDGMISGSMNKRIKEIHSGAPSPADVLQKENTRDINTTPCAQKGPQKTLRFFFAFELSIVFCPPCSQCFFGSFLGAGRNM
jgi:hypothetical protein